MYLLFVLYVRVFGVVCVVMRSVEHVVVQRARVCFW